MAKSLKPPWERIREDARVGRDCPLWANALREDAEREVAFKQLVKDLSLIKKALTR